MIILSVMVLDEVGNLVKYEKESKESAGGCRNRKMYLRKPELAGRRIHKALRESIYFKRNKGTSI